MFNRQIEEANNNESATKKSDTLSPPTISLPKGGGAIRGIGEKFAANPVTGTGSLSVPIFTSPGRSGFGPQLSLSYDSGAGNGPFGLGWNLSLPSITRKTDKGLPKYQDAEESDVFILSGAEDLVPVLVEKDGEWQPEQLPPRTVDGKTFSIQRYRPRIEGLFARIERWTNQTDHTDVFWRSISKDNITTWYGKTDKSRIADPADPSRIFSWLICESYDDKGNAIVYEYKPENSERVDLSEANEKNRTRGTNRYLKRIKYGNRTPNRDVDWNATDPTQLSDWMFEVVFDYGEHYSEDEHGQPTTVFVNDDQREWDIRHDPFSSYRAGFEVRTYRLCQRVLMFHHFPGEQGVGQNCLVRSTEFHYDEGPIASFITQVIQSGYVRQNNGTNPYLKKSLPPLEFEYSQAIIQEEIRTVDAESLENLPQGLDGTQYKWADIDGEGLSGILTEQSDSWFYKRNVSALPVVGADGKPHVVARFAPTECLARIPSFTNLAEGRQQLLDLAGDGQLDVVEFDSPTPGFYERTKDETWHTFRPFQSLPNISWQDPNLKFVDLNGDGHADIFITEDAVFTWYPSLAEDGFGSAEKTYQSPDEEQGPRLVFADGTQSIHLADISGDGLTDLVRIRNGEVCYWPNLGYGRFGARVTMDNSPHFDAPDQFDQSRIRLADIDGSGVTDILYLKDDGVYIYLNESGNRWADANKLQFFPPIDNLSSVMAVDLLGNGTACLVWSSPLPGEVRKPLRYIDLMGGQKPHLLVKTVNNLGAETHVHYAPSTKFYLADKEAGKPWITRIPFPVHVVERVETYDRISRNCFITRYAYHHGYFDGEEREFRGFGLVEQWDTERFAEGASQSLPPKYEIGQVATYIIRDAWQFSFRPIIDIKPSMYPNGGWFYFFKGINSGIHEDDVLLLEEAGEHALGHVWDGTSEEEFAVLTGDASPSATNIDEASHVPPVLTRTWFHTGAYLDRDHISDFYAGIGKGDGEYYREPSLRGDDANDSAAEALLLPDTVLPPGLTSEEEREACRALKGSMLRQEVYALDETATNDYPHGHPYIVTEQNFTIKRIQPKTDNRHAVFFTPPLEAINYHYERNPADPRIAHTMTLEVDDFGNVLKEAAIGYGRRQSNVNLSAEDQAKQTRPLVTYTENHVTNAIDLPVDDQNYDPDNYRTPLPCETRTYELTGYPPTGAAGRFQFPDFVQPDPTDPDGWKRIHIFDGEVNYEDIPPNGRQRRLIEHLRTLYRPNDLGVSLNDPLALLPSKTLESLALPGETYKLAFTQGLIDKVYERYSQKLIPHPDVMLKGSGGDKGGYVDLDGDDRWWIPAGRVFHSPNKGDSAGQELNYARRHFFLPHRYRDPFGQTTTVIYDGYDLLPQETRDSLDNRITVGERDMNDNVTTPGNDYRVLQPTLVTDANRNRTAVAFDALGMVVGTAVMGKPFPAPNEGDSLVDFETDLTDTVILDHLANPLTDPHVILKHATTRLVYDLFAYHRTKARPDPQPAVVYALARETHDADLDHDAGEHPRIQHSFSYSDGFGREIQKKIRAEPEKINGVAGPPRWVGSGWTIFNNKGKPVRQYEPFFSKLPPTQGHCFEFDLQVGVSPILFYDPVERVVATLHPNHTYEKVVFDPWRQMTWDVNDTIKAPDNPGDPPFDPKNDPDVGKFFRRLPDKEYLPTWYDLRTDPAKALQAWPDTDASGQPIPENAKRRASEKRAAEKSSVHANTPTTAHFDTLGRPFLTVALNRFERKKPDNTIKIIEEPPYHTRIELDIEGNQRTVRDAIMQNGDALGRIVMRYDYDMFGTRLHQASMEAGECWMLNDISGNPIRAWDSRHFLHRMTYDELRRPTDLYVTENGAERLAEKTIYGENQGDGNNHRSRVYQVFDGAGTVTSMAYDFKGNLLESRRDLLPIVISKQAVDWQQNPVANDGNFTTITTYDALNRPFTETSPDGSVYRPTFNEANLLDKVEVNLRGERENGQPKWTPFVINIDYNAKGQRELIAYQNGATTTYTYDKFTFRLTNLKTTRPAGLNGIASQLFTDSTVVQDLHYAYDPVGNIIRIEDTALKTVVHNGQQVEPVSSYTYDAIYRLIEVQGREHTGQTAFNFNPSNGNYCDYPFVGYRAHPNDLQALRIYTERYEYDAVGNFDVLRHIANGGNWTRHYDYEEESLIEVGKQSNRLTRTTVGNGLNHIETYIYKDVHGNDVHGCMAAINTMKMVWDSEDQLQQVELGGGGTAYYIYDAVGQRVRKVIESQNGTRRKERIYLGGFEMYREYNGNGGTVILERESLNVMDDQRRIALVEIQTIKNGNPVNAPTPLQRYQLANHLGSASLELAEDGELISYEEYHSYGTTAFQTGRSAAEVSLKRYRYTGKERDDESGLYYYGARYYASWLGRWISSDPADLVDGTNLYSYTQANPTSYTDPLGLWTWKGVWKDVKNAAKAGAGAVYGAGKVIGGAVVGVGKATYYTTSKALYDATGSDIWKEQAETYDRGIEAIAKTFEGGPVDAVKNYVKSRGDRFMAAVDAGDHFAAGQAFGEPAMELALLADAAANGPKISFSPAPAMATTTGRIVQAGGRIVMTAPAPAPAVMAMAMAGKNMTKEESSGKKGGKTSSKATPARPRSSSSRQIRARGFPLGFRSLGQFRQFGQALKAGLKRAGFADADAAFQGSSVTGKSFRTGEAFDAGRISDFDIALSSPTLLDRARSLGIALRGGGTRTGPLSAAHIEQLGLTEMQARLTGMAGGRPVNFMIFGDKTHVAAKGASLWVH